MIDTSPTSQDSRTWEQEIRDCEEEARAAFLSADVETLDRLWTDGFAVNAPLQRILEKKQVIEALRSGTIRHDVFEIEIEHMSRHGDVVVVMGRDRVTNPPDKRIVQRRFTNIWQRESGTWRSIARHAHALSGQPAASRSDSS